MHLSSTINCPNLFGSSSSSHRPPNVFPRIDLTRSPGAEQVDKSGRLEPDEMDRPCDGVSYSHAFPLRISATGPLYLAQFADDSGDASPTHPSPPLVATTLPPDG
jgi:hypothetical protein